MSKYYTPKRQKYLFDPASTEPYRMSRSKVDLFLECPRCFYLDRRLGIARPPGFPFSLNAAVDTLLKREFDGHRESRTPHPLMSAHGIKAVPFAHEKLNEWRDSLRGGVTFVHQPLNLLLTGGIDDLWVTPEGELIVVDYKATSKNDPVSLDADWQIGYKRQMEFYQWLLRQNGFTVSNIGYFVYCNGRANAEAFANKLEFEVTIIPYKGDDSWVEKTLESMIGCLRENNIPAASEDCDYCRYLQAVGTADSR